MFQALLNTLWALGGPLLLAWGGLDVAREQHESSVRPVQAPASSGMAVAQDGGMPSSGKGRDGGASESLRQGARGSQFSTASSPLGRGGGGRRGLGSRAGAGRSGARGRVSAVVTALKSAGRRVPKFLAALYGMERVAWRVALWQGAWDKFMPAAGYWTSPTDCGPELSPLGLANIGIMGCVNCLVLQPLLVVEAFICGCTNVLQGDDGGVSEAASGTRMHSARSEGAACARATQATGAFASALWASESARFWAFCVAVVHGVGWYGPRYMALPLREAVNRPSPEQRQRRVELRAAAETPALAQAKLLGGSSAGPETVYV